MALSVQRPPQLPGQLRPSNFGLRIQALGGVYLLRRRAVTPSSVPDIQTRRASHGARPRARGTPVTWAQYSIERVAEKGVCEEETGVVIMDQSGTLYHSQAQLHHFASLFRQVTKRENVEIAQAEEAADGLTLEQAVRSCVQRGAERVIVVPYCTSKNPRADPTLPFLLAEVQQRLPPRTRVVTAEAIGLDTLLVQLIENRVAAIEPTNVEVSERGWSDDAAAAQSSQAPTPKAVASQREAARALPEQGAAGGAGRLSFQYGNDLGGERGWAAEAEAMQPRAAAAAPAAKPPQAAPRPAAPSTGPSVWRDEPMPAQQATAPAPAAAPSRPAVATLAAEAGTGHLTFEREALREDSRELAEAVRKMGDDVRALVADVQALKSLASQVNQQSSDMACLKAEVAALRTSVEGIERSRAEEQQHTSSSSASTLTHSEVEVLPGLGDDSSAESSWGTWQQGGWGGDGSSAERGWGAGAGPQQGGSAGPSSHSAQGAGAGAWGDDVIDVSPDRGWGAAAAAERGWGEQQQGQQAQQGRGRREGSPRPSRSRWRGMVGS